VRVEHESPSSFLRAAPDTPKLTDTEIIKVLHSYGLMIKELRECVSFVIEQVLRHRLTETKQNRDNQSLKYIQRRLNLLEERIDGAEGGLKYTLSKIQEHLNGTRKAKKRPRTGIDIL
jgi:hypothetical protein